MWHNELMNTVVKHRGGGGQCGNMMVCNAKKYGEQYRSRAVVGILRMKLLKNLKHGVPV